MTVLIAINLAVPTLWLWCNPHLMKDLITYPWIVPSLWRNSVVTLLLIPDCLSIMLSSITLKPLMDLLILDAKIIFCSLNKHNLKITPPKLVSLILMLIILNMMLFGKILIQANSIGSEVVEKSLALDLKTIWFLIGLETYSEPLVNKFLSIMVLPQMIVLMMLN